jgi:hypothetical protein
MRAQLQKFERGNRGLRDDQKIEAIYERGIIRPGLCLNNRVCLKRSRLPQKSE